MEKKENRWIASLREFRELRTVAACGLLAAAAVILNYVTTINFGPFVKVGFSGLPNQVVSYLFGPAAGGIFGAVLDVLKWMLRPDGTFFPGFTLSAALGGIIYGLFLYRRPLKLWRVFAAQLAVKLFVNLCLNTLWLVILYNKVATVILPERALSNLIMLPIDTAIMYFMLKAVSRAVRPAIKKD